VTVLTGQKTQPTVKLYIDLTQANITSKLQECNQLYTRPNNTLKTKYTSTPKHIAVKTASRENAKMRPLKHRQPRPDTVFTLNISETVRDRGLVPKDHQYEMAYGLLNGHVTDDVT